MTSSTSSTRQAKKAKYRRYFQEQDPELWDILGFIDACAQADQHDDHRFDYGLAMDTWVKTINRLLTDPDHLVSRRARELYDAYHVKGHHSDKYRAKRHRQALQSSPSDLVINYFTTNYGRSHYGQSINITKRGKKFKPTTDVTRTIDECDSDSPAPEVETVNESAVSTFASVGASLVHARNKLALDNGRFLEDIVHSYCQSCPQLDLAHWGVIDRSDPELLAILQRNDWSSTDSKYSSRHPPLPTFLNTYMDGYAHALDVEGCRRLAHTTDTTLVPTDPLYHHRFLKRWIDRSYEHVASLVTETNDLMSLPLCEGAWEGLYWVLLDLAFVNLTDLYLQRRDTTLRALENDSNSVVTTSYRFDGIVLTRPHVRFSHPLEIAVIEASRKYDPSIWNNDIAKLYAACRSMLNNFKTIVKHDPIVMKNLASVGILQAGSTTMILIMRCIGDNLFTLTRGTLWNLPSQPHELPALKNVLAAIWIAREVICQTFKCILDYTATNASGARPGSDNAHTDPSRADFL